MADLQAQQEAQAAQQDFAPPADDFDQQLIQIQKLSFMKDQGLFPKEEFAAKRTRFSDCRIFEITQQFWILAEVSISVEKRRYGN